MASTRDHSLPPGTVYLLEYEAARDSSEIVLVPRPTNDPNEPLNWSMTRKAINFVLIVAMAAMAFTLVTFQATFWQQMVVDLDTSMDLLSNGNSAQLAGLALGCFFFIPFAVKYGRRPVYIVSVAVMAGGSWWSSRLQSYPEMMVANFLTGLAGSINETTVQMTISDLFFVHQRGTANAVYFLGVMIGSFVCPIPAGAIAATEGWRWSYYALSIALTGLTIIFIFAFEETKYIRRPTTTTVGPSDHEAGTDTKESDPPSPGAAQDERKESNPLDVCTSARETSTEAVPALNTYWQRMRLITPTDESLWEILIAPLRVIFFPHVLYPAIQFSFTVSWLVLLVIMSSIFFSSPPYNFTTAGIGYMNLGPFVGAMLGAVYGGPVSDWSVKYFAKRNGGVFEPEMRLYLLAVPAFVMSGGLIMFGVTASMGLHWIFPSIGGAMFAAGLGASGEITFTFVIDTYREIVAEAFVGISFLRNVGGIILPLVRPHGAAAMGFKNQFILVGAIAFTVAMLHIPMIIWGKTLRRRFAPRYYKVVKQLQAKNMTTR